MGGKKKYIEMFGSFTEPFHLFCISLISECVFVYIRTSLSLVFLFVMCFAVGCSGFVVASADGLLKDASSK